MKYSTVQLLVPLVGRLLALMTSGRSKRHLRNGFFMMIRVSSHDVTAAMLVPLHKGTAAILVSPTNPLGIELYSYASAFFCFTLRTCSLIM